jgi:hypothetical protein
VNLKGFTEEDSELIIAIGRKLNQEEKAGKIAEILIK